MDKPGYKTTEWYLTCAAMLVGLFMAGGFFSQDSVVMQVAGFIGMILAKLGYTYSRTNVKTAEPAAKQAGQPVPL